MWRENLLASWSAEPHSTSTPATAYSSTQLSSTLPGSHPSTRHSSLQPHHHQPNPSNPASPA
jgi:hypothetical protein